MLLYVALWTRVFPDLRRLRRADRKVAIRAAMGPVYTLAGEQPPPARSWFGRISGALGLLLFVPLMLANSPRTFALMVVPTMLVAWLLTPLGLLLYAVRRRNTFIRHLRREITGLGQPICVACGYDLRAARGLRCSECGDPLPLMRFRVRTLVSGGQPPRDWSVTALSAAHARDLLEEYLCAHHDTPPQIISVLQVVEERIGACGEIIPA